MRYLLLSILLGLTAGTSLARTEQCKAVTKNDIEGLFDRWNRSLRTGDPEKVVANYAKPSVLLPTLSNVMRITPALQEHSFDDKTEDKLSYFKYFLAKKPSGKIDKRFIEIGCNSAVDSGIYTFTFGDNTSEQARYTFTYRWDGKQWLITSHHSSLMPEKTK